MKSRSGRCKLVCLCKCVSFTSILLFGGFVSVATAQEVMGTSKIGPRTSNIFTLRIPPSGPTAGDTLPPGSGIVYQFSIFDTGSNTVAINNVPTSDGTTTFLSTANILDLCAPGDADCPAPTGIPPRIQGLPVLDVRVWGLGRVDIGGGGAPLDMPEAEIGNILVRPTSVPVNLLGAPVANNVIAYIDYTTVIDHANIFIPGADITFYNPGAAGIPVPMYALQLARFGDTTPAIEGATRGSFYSLENFSFANNGNIIYANDMLTQPDSSVRGAKVFFDTGNTTTQVTRPMADALGITPATPVDDTVTVNLPSGGTSTLNCYTISAAEFYGTGSSLKYSILSPLVCVSNDSEFGGSGNPHDVILGTNYFEQTQILLDGPNDRLGMFRGVTNTSVPHQPTDLIINR